MKLLNFNKVLCLSPHPDDVEYSMSGTILKCCDTKFDILCLTQGGDCDETSEPARLEETKRCWEKMLATTSSPNWNLFFTEWKFLKELGEDQWINYIETNFTNKIDYDCIITPPQRDSHFEHRAVAAFGPALIRRSASSLINYNSPSALQSWVPNIFIDISDFYETKMRLLEGFVSQSSRAFFSPSTLRAFHSNFQWSKKGLHYVEQFKLIEMISK